MPHDLSFFPYSATGRLYFFSQTFDAVCYSYKKRDFHFDYRIKFVRGLDFIYWKEPITVYSCEASVLGDILRLGNLLQSAHA